MNKAFVKEADDADDDAADAALPAIPQGGKKLYDACRSSTDERRITATDRY